MKSLLLSAFVFTAFTTFSQTYIKDLPVREGIVTELFTHKYGLINKSDGVEITTKNDSCFSTEDAVVISTFNLEGEYAVTLKTADGMFATYSHLSNTVVSKGKEIKKGTFLGLLAKDEEGHYQLLYMLSNNKGRFLTRDKHVSYLQSNSTR